MARLGLTLLGGFQARLDPGGAVALPTKKAQALLAYLALPLGQAHPRDKLAALLWGGIREESARNSLRQALFAVRKALATTDPASLMLERDTIALDRGAVSVDVADFERLLADGSPEARERASALYQGDLLAGLALDEPPFEEWLLGGRGRLRGPPPGGAPGAGGRQKKAGGGGEAGGRAPRRAPPRPPPAAAGSSPCSARRASARAGSSPSWPWKPPGGGSQCCSGAPTSRSRSCPSRRGSTRCARAASPRMRTCSSAWAPPGARSSRGSCRRWPRVRPPRARRWTTGSSSRAWLRCSRSFPTSTRCSSSWRPSPGRTGTAGGCS